jgi:hypothetical protein
MKRWPSAAWLGAIVVLSVLTQGYLVGPINHGLQIPLIRHYAGETSFDADPFIVEMARTYTSAFYPALGIASRWVPLDLLLLVLFVACRAASVALAYRLAIALFEDRAAALWTAALLSLQSFTFAEDIVSDIYLTHGALAQVMTLGSLVLLAEGRIAAAFAVAGLMFTVHGMHSTHLLPVMGLAVLLDRSPGSSLGSRIRPLALGSALALLLAAPTVAWMISAKVLGAPVPPGYADAVKAWFPTHFWPSTWGALDVVSLLAPVALAWPSARLAGPAKDGGQVGRVAMLALAAGVLGGLLVEIAPIPFLIRLHPMRLSWIMSLAGAPYLARAAVQMARADNPRIALPAAALLMMGLGLGMATRNSYWLTISPAIAIAALPERTRERRAPLLLLLLVLLVLAVPVAMYAVEGRIFEPMPGARRNFLFGAVFVEGLLGGIAGFILVAGWLLRRRGPYTLPERRTLFRFTGGVAALMLILHGVFVFRSRVKGLDRDWLDAQAWCAEALKPGEVVLVPLAQIGFRVMSKQTPAVDFQEGDALLHDPEYTRVFIPKLELYGWAPAPIHGLSHWTRLDPLDKRLTEADALRIGATLHAGFAVRRTEHPPWRLPEVYRNDSFVIYRLDAPAS